MIFGFRAIFIAFKAIFNRLIRDDLARKNREKTEPLMKRTNTPKKAKQNKKTARYS